jgi:hypothetical protein
MNTFLSRTSGVSTGLTIIFLLSGMFRMLAQPLIETNAATEFAGPGRLTGGGSVGSRALANQVNDPTASLTLFQFRDILIPSVPGYSSPANVLELDPVFPIFPSRLLPFEQLMKVTLPFPTTPNPGSQTGLGDLSLFDVATFKESWGKWGFGPALVFPTATSTALGQGKWQAGPAVAVIYTGVKSLTAGVVAQNPISYAGSASRPDVNSLSLTPTLTYNLPQGWFAGYNDFDITFDWENGGRATVPVGPQAGRIFKIGNVPVSLSLEGAWVPVRPSGSPEWLVGVEFTVIFRTVRTPH